VSGVACVNRVPFRSWARRRWALSSATSELGGGGRGMLLVSSGEQWWRCVRAGFGVARRRVLVSGREVRGTHPFFPSSYIRATLIVTFSTINFGIYPIYAAAFGGAVPLSAMFCTRGGCCWLSPLSVRQRASERRQWGPAHAELIRDKK